MRKDGLLSMLDPDLVIQEAMYGFIMALTLITTAQLGWIQYEDRTSLILAIAGMDFVWGAIDMFIFYRADIMARSRRLKKYSEVLSTEDPEKQADLLLDELDDTLFEMMSEADRRRIVRMFLEGKTVSTVWIRKTNHHYLFNAVTAFVVSVTTVAPSVFCLWLIEDFSNAAISASLISVIALFFLGYGLAPYGDRRYRLFTGFTTAMISLAFVIFAAYFGG